jgi:hypothetical protein
MSEREPSHEKWSEAHASRLEVRWDEPEFRKVTDWCIVEHGTPFDRQRWHSDCAIGPLPWEDAEARATRLAGVVFLLGIKAWPAEAARAISEAALSTPGQEDEHG